ncbi:YdcF family protein [Gymnodinialimonas ulvae]|uniref:YdcF family protein n=1 Tax=Gymnodinialimonas ulvae TaxID=3126504 RepID=UPI0030B421AB
MALIRHKKMARVRRVLRLTVMFYAATLALVLGSNWFWPRDTAPAPAAQIICLGGAVSRGVLAEDSLMRAERCGGLLLAGHGERVILTGDGAGTLMADHLRAMGIEEARITVEPESRSTLQNALFTARITQTDAPVIVVTDAYHLLRSWVSFRLMGFDHVHLASSEAMVDRTGPMFREVSAIWFNALRLLIYTGTFWVEPAVRDALLA